MNPLILNSYARTVEKLAGEQEPAAPPIKKSIPKGLRTAWKIVRDAGITAAGFGTGYIGAGVIHRGVLKPLGVPDPFRNLPPEKRIKALRVAAGITGMAVSAAGLGVRAGRSHHRKLERERDRQNRTG